MIDKETAINKVLYYLTDRLKHPIKGINAFYLEKLFFNPKNSGWVITVTLDVEMDPNHLIFEILDNGEFKPIKTP
jgi:hypothetical protein